MIEEKGIMIDQRGLLSRVLRKGLPVEFSQELAFNTLRKDGCFPLGRPSGGDYREGSSL
jgi:hypothetical protein